MKLALSPLTKKCLIAVGIIGVLYGTYQNRRFICKVDEAKMQSLMLSRLPKNGLKQEFKDIRHLIVQKYPGCCIVRKYDNNPKIAVDDSFYVGKKRNKDAYYYIKLKESFFDDYTNPLDPNEVLEKTKFFLFEADQCGQPLSAWGGNVEDSGEF